MDLLLFFESSPIAYQCFITVLGLLVGSFLNVVILRLPRTFMEDMNGVTVPSFFSPLSQCLSCQKPIRPYDNIPILSYCLLKGRCRYCKCGISLRYPAIELLTAALSLMVSIRYGVSLNTLMGLLLTWALISLAVIDLEHMILPDNITLPFLWIGLFISIFPIFRNCQDVILGAIAGYLSLWSIYWIFKLLFKKEGMGYGDFKLTAMLGAWLGWQALPFIILLSSLLGSLVGISLLISKKHKRLDPLPFGPFLAFSGWVALLLGPNVLLYSVIYL